MINIFNKDKNVISAKKAKEMMDTSDVVVIDVREEHEYKNGHVKNALLIPLDTIGQNKDIMPSLDETLLVYCRSGQRSKKGAQQFRKLGYQSVFDFGGILDWPYEIEK